MPDTRLRLLVVDDEPSLRRSFSLVFHQLGYDVRSAEDGFSALSEMRKEIPDILLSDLNMPGMSGFELLSVVRRRFPAVPVIAMSGCILRQRGATGRCRRWLFSKGQWHRPLAEHHYCRSQNKAAVSAHYPHRGAYLDFAKRIRLFWRAPRHHCLPGVHAALSPRARRLRGSHKQDGLRLLRRFDPLCDRPGAMRLMSRNHSSTEDRKRCPVRSIAERNVLLRVRVELPEGIKLSTKEFQEGWSLARRVDAYRLEMRILTRGWNFIKIGDGSLRAGVGETSQEAIACALRLSSSLRKRALQCHDIREYRSHAISMVLSGEGKSPFLSHSAGSGAAGAR